jgi:hypothetical protein
MGQREEDRKVEEDARKERKVYERSVSTRRRSWSCIEMERGEVKIRDEEVRADKLGGDEGRQRVVLKRCRGELVCCIRLDLEECLYWHWRRSRPKTGEE